MKTLYFFLFSFVLLGLSQSYAQGAIGGGNQQPGGNQGNNAPAAAGVNVNLKSSKTAASKSISTDGLKMMSRKGLRFQLMDANGKAVKGAERRIKYSETTGNVDVDVVGLPAAPKGRNYRLRVTNADKTTTTDVDLK